MTHVLRLATNFLTLPLQDPEREAELGSLLGQAEVGEVFPMLVSYGKLITDYSTDAPAEPEEGDALDDDIGVAVEFEGDEDDEDSEGDEVMVRAACSGLRGR